MASDPLPTRTTGAAELDAYLRANDITLDAFALKMKVSGVTVHRWVKGKARPTVAAARQIESATGIRAALFFPEIATLMADDRKVA